MNARTLVFDDAAGNRTSHSMRKYDENGFMRVADCPLTKEQVAEYIGHEVPGWERLGLDPKRIYHVYRPASELSKAETLASVKNIFLLLDHAPVTPDDVQPDRIIGNVGEKVRWDGKYLRCNLNIMAKKAQDRIKDQSMRELSLSYAYKPELSKGVFKGQHYDIVMRDIRANHLALVEAGRAGSDVRVNDALPKELYPMNDTTEILKLIDKILSLRAQGNMGATVDSDEAMDEDAKDQEQDQAFAASKEEEGQDPEAPEGADTDDEDAKDSDEASDSDEAQDSDEAEDSDEQAEDDDGDGADDEDTADDEDAEDSDEQAEDDDEMFTKLLESINAEVTEENLAALKKLAGSNSGDSEPQAQDSARALRRAKARKTRKLASDSRRIEAVRSAALREGATKAAKYINSSIKGRYRAAEEVAPFIGRVDIFAYDSAAAIYKEAAIAVGLSERLARDPKVVRGYLLSQRQNLGINQTLANDSRRKESGVDAVMKILETVQY